MTDLKRVELGWPAAATMIAAMIGAAATSIAWAMAPESSGDDSSEVRYATSREIGEVKARLDAIEHSGRQLRSELRADIKELRDLTQQLIKQR